MIRRILAIATLVHMSMFALWEAAPVDHSNHPTGNHVVDTILLPIGAFTWGVIMVLGVVQIFDRGSKGE